MSKLHKEAMRQVRSPLEPVGFQGCITAARRFEESSSYIRHKNLFGVKAMICGEQDHGTKWPDGDAKVITCKDRAPGR